jgi:tRNA U54 and U55 pseudouridine synthase Pus10
VAVKVARAAVFVAGRYRKLGRNISNSPWLPGKCATSVSEELARALLPVMRADSYKFNSAGTCCMLSAAKHGGITRNTSA